MDDWQLSRHEIRERGKYLLQSGKWADCNFLIGNEPNQQIVPGHKLILASASPVFEAMFYGQLAEKNEHPIPILDVQPEAFKAILEYIYTDHIFINSVDKACEVCYGAKKYMIPFIVQQCSQFLWSNLSTKNVLKAYEFAKLFEEPLLLEKCLEIVCTKTLEVLTDPGFEEIEFKTLLDILDQEYLNIDSELDLFFAITRYADKNRETPTQESATQQQSTSTETSGTENNTEANSQAELQSSSGINFRDAIKKIRFLTLSPQQFADHPGRSSFLDQKEAFAILMNVSSANSGHPMPDGFSINRNLRVEKYDSVTVLASPSPVSVPNETGNSSRYEGQSAMDEGRDMVETRKYYCVRTIRQQTDCLNTSALDCSVTFNVDISICITGVQVPTQVFGDTNMQHPYSDRYSEILYAHLLDSHGSRLTYTHCTPRVRFDSLMEISFDRPVYIQSHRMYKIGVVFNKVGWYPMCKCVPAVTCDNVFFSFGVGQSNESVRDGLIRAIVFTHTSDNG